MERYLLDLNRVADLVGLIGGDAGVRDAKQQTLLEIGGGLTDEFPSDRALLGYYQTAYILMAHTSPPAESLPSERQVRSTSETHHGAGQLVARHFAALGAINGMAAANPNLMEFAKLLVLFSLHPDIAELLRFIAGGLGIMGDDYTGAASIIQPAAPGREGV